MIREAWNEKNKGDINGWKEEMKNSRKASENGGGRE